VKTSNPGSGDLQDQKLASGHTVSEFFAQEVANLSERVVGKSGYSSIGAVVGATYPEQAEKLRHAMPNSYFLIPGLGSQGGSAKEAVAGFDTNGGGGIVNASRGIFSSFTSPNVSVQGALDHIVNKVKSFNGELASALRI
jgi:orotidine-5'-phosphate decarboxylase